MLISDCSSDVCSSDLSHIGTATMAVIEKDECIIFPNWRAVQRPFAPSSIASAPLLFTLIVVDHSSLRSRDYRQKVLSYRFSWHPYHQTTCVDQSICLFIPSNVQALLPNKTDRA